MTRTQDLRKLENFKETPKLLRIDEEVLSRLCKSQILTVMLQK